MPAARSSSRPGGADLPAALPNATLPDATVRATRAAALAALLGLIALGVAWELWLAPTGSGTLAVKVLPLLLCVAGVVRHRMFIFRWLSLLVWLYFAEGVVRAATDSGLSRALAADEIVLCLVLFSACAAYIRHRLRSAPKPVAAEGSA